MKVFVPVLASKKRELSLNSRLEQFENRTITFLDNMKAGAEVFLDELRRILKAKYPGMSYQRLQKPSMSDRAPEPIIQQAARSHAVITGFGD